MTTNSGTDRKSVCWEEHEHAVRVAHGDTEDDTTFAFVCSLERMTESLRSRLEDAATRSDISMNSEILERLERSFERQDLLPETLMLAFRDEELAGVVLLIGEAMSYTISYIRLRERVLAGGPTGSWMDDPKSLHHAALAAITVIGALLGSAEPVADRTERDLGEIMALHAMSEVKSGPPDNLVPAMRDLLGPVVKRLPDVDDQTDAALRSNITNLLTWLSDTVDTLERKSAPSAKSKAGKP